MSPALFCPAWVSLDGTASTLQCPVLISPGCLQQHMGPRAVVQRRYWAPLLIWEMWIAYISSNLQIFIANIQTVSEAWKSLCQFGLKSVMYFLFFSLRLKQVLHPISFFIFIIIDETKKKKSIVKCIPVEVMCSLIFNWLLKHTHLLWPKSAPPYVQHCVN